MDKHVHVYGLCSQWQYTLIYCRFSVSSSPIISNCELYMCTHGLLIGIILQIITPWKVWTDWRLTLSLLSPCMDICLPQPKQSKVARVLNPYLAAFFLLFGEFLYMYMYMSLYIGCAQLAPYCQTHCGQCTTCKAGFFILSTLTIE